MATIAEIRSKFPQYSDMSDAELADALYKKFYSDIPRAEFNSKIGLEIKPPAPSTERTFGEAIKDVPASLATGIGGLLQFPGQLVQLVPGLQEVGQALETPGKAVREFGQDLKSAGLKAREALRSQAISEAEKEGILSEFATAITSTIKDPALITSFIAEQVPLLLGPAAAAKVAQKATAAGVAATTAGTAAREAAEAAAAKTATRAAIGTGAAMQAGDISSNTYQTAYQRAIEMGMTPEQANSEALNAARIAAAGAGAVSLGATVGLGKLGGAAIERRLAGLPGAGRIRSGVGEATSETLEESGGQLFSNIGVRTVDPNQSLTEGIGSAAAMGALGGGFFGTLLGKRPDAELVPGQRPGESLYDTAARLNRDIKSLEDLVRMGEPSAPKTEGIMSISQLFDIASKPADQGGGYGAVRIYLEQLNQMPPSPERNQAVADTKELLQRMNMEEFSRQQTARTENIITNKDLAQQGFSFQDPMYKEVLGKDVSKPEDYQAVMGAIDAALQRKGLRQTQRERIETFKRSIEEYIATIPGGGFYANQPVEPTTGERPGLAGVTGARAATEGFGESVPSGVVPTEPITEKPARRKAKPAAPLTEEEITPQAAVETPAVEETAGEKVVEEVAAPSVPTVPAKEAQAPAPVPVAEAVNLPKELAGAKPRYSYGSKQFQLTFDNDISKALYITAQATPSKRDADYRAWLLNQGFTPAQIDTEGKAVREQIKSIAKDADPKAGPIAVPAKPAPVKRSLRAAEPLTEQDVEGLGVRRTAPAFKRIVGKTVEEARPELDAYRKLPDRYVSRETKAKIAAALGEKVEEAKPEVKAEAPKEAPKEKTQREAILEKRGELIKELDKVLNKILAKYGLKDVKLNLEEGFADEGSYSAQIIKLALDLDNPVRVLRHEAIHALKDMGFFSDAQWNTLVQTAKDKWVQTYLKDVPHTDTQSRYDAYVELLGKEAKDKGLTGAAADKYIEDSIIEEAIADAFGAFDLNKAPPGMMAALLKRMKNLFKAVKEAFGSVGIDTAEDIFGKIEKGSLKPAISRGKEQAPKKSLRGVPLSTRPIMEASPIFAMNELGLKTEGEKKPGGIFLFNDVRSIANALNNDTINNYGVIDREDRSPYARNIIARAIADEVAYQVGTTSETGTGLGWYSNNYPRAVKRLAKKYPELGYNPHARSVFSALVAVTSNGEKVSLNIKNAIGLYAKLRAGKPMVAPGSRRATALDNNLQVVQDLLAKHGENFKNVLLQEILVKDMNAEFRARGKKPSGDYLATTKIPAAAIYFGPKLGAFYANLEGAEGYLTMDMWWTRSINRMRGLLMPQATESSINRFRDLAGNPDMTRDEVISATIPLRNRYEELDWTTELEYLAGEKEPSTNESKPRWTARAKRITGPAYKQLRLEHDVMKMANTIHKNEYEMLEEAPFGPNDREFMYRAARDAQRLLKQDGIDLTLADIQAALWYYEKRLYQHLSGRKADDIGYDEAISAVARESDRPEGRSVVFDKGVDRGAVPGASVEDVDGVRGQPAEGEGVTDEAIRFREPAVRPSLRGREGIEETVPGRRPEPTRDRGRRDQGRSLAPLAGAPNVSGATGPDPRLVEVAESYADKYGIPYSRQEVYVEVDEDRARRIAQAYEDMAHAPQDPKVKEAYRDLIEQTRNQYDALIDAGYKFTFFDSNTDPYGGNPFNAMRDLRQNKTMAVYGTYDGYGTEGITGAAVEDNPMLEDTGLRWPDQDGVEHMVTANDLFRAVHDAFGHGLEGAGFRARGEENAWQAHVRLFTGPAVGAITSETRGQNSWLNYGPYGDKNRTAKLEDTVFAEQKTGLMPEWTWTDGTEESKAPTKASLRGVVLGTKQPDAQSYTGTHYGNAKVDTLLGSKYGSGIRGAERRRLETTDDDRIKRRVYFYVPKTDGAIPLPEAGLGQYVYTQKFDNILGPSKEMSRLFSEAAGDANTFESLIVDAGYDGYAVPNMGMMVILNHDAPVEYKGTRAELAEKKSLRTSVQNSLFARRMKNIGINSTDDFWKRIQNVMIGTGSRNPALSAISDTRSTSDQVKQAISVWKQDVEKSGIKKYLQRFLISTGVPEMDDIIGAKTVKNMLVEAGIRPTLANAIAAYESLPTVSTDGAINDTRFSLRSETPQFKFWFGQSKIVDKDGKPKVMYHGTGKDITSFEGKTARGAPIFLTDEPDVARSFASDSQAFVRNKLAEEAPFEIRKQKAYELLDKLKRTAFKGPEYKTRIQNLEVSLAQGRLNDVIFLDEEGYSRLFADMVPSGANIMPLYVKAEYPFDYDKTSDLLAIVATPSGKKLSENKLSSIAAGAWDIIETPDVQRAIKEAGFDSFYVREEGKKNLAVYSPTQVVSAIGNVGAYRQRPITAEEAARFGMTEEQAADAQKRGDIRFSLRSKGQPVTRENVVASMLMEQSKQPFMNCQLCVQMATGVSKVRDLPKVKTAGIGDIYTFNETKDMASHYAIDVGDGDVAEIEAWGEEVRVIPLSQVTDEYGEPSAIRRPPDTAYTDKKLSLRSPIGLYSELENKVEAVSSKAAPAGQWKTMIAAMTQKGVKPEEIEWSGVNDWLDLQTGKVTKDDLLEYLRANGVQVEEVQLGGRESWRQELDILENRGRINLNAQERERYDELMDRRRKEGLPADESPAKYQDYTLPGGENYREVLLTLPDRTDPQKERIAFEKRMEQKYGEFNSMRFTDAEKAESEKTMQAILDAGGVVSKRAVYKSSHWKQLNIIAHIRVNDRTDADGNRVLFVEEIQSDWGQEGKKRGFAPQNVEAQLKESEERMRRRGEEIRRLSDRMAALTDNELDEFNRLADERQRLQDEQGEEIDFGNRLYDARASGIPIAPFVTKTEGWLNLALKRIMIMAAEGGYDKVAFVNGEQSAERYDLSKQIDGIGYNKNDDGTIDITVYRNRSTLMDKTMQTPDQVEELIGKELTRKIVDSPRRTDAIEGLDLKIGGEGMKTFYDKIVPTAVKKLLPKVGGSKIEIVEIPDPKGTGRTMDVRNFLGEWETIKIADEPALQQQGFDVTPSMKEKVATTGLPKFSLRSAPTTPEFKRWFGDSKVVDADGKPMVVFHASTNFEGYEFKKSPKVNRTGNPDGYYFSPSPSDAADYARDLEYVADRINNPEKYDKDYPIPYAQGAEIIPVYLSVKNPYDYKAKTKPSREMIRQFEKELRKDNPNLGDDWISEKLDIFKEGRWPNISFPTDAMTRVIKSGGYDGMKDGRHWIAFDSNQIKSATGNIGTYDVTSPDIRRSLRSTLPASVVKSMDKIAPPRYEPNLAQRMMDAVSGDGFTRIRQYLLNRYEALAALDRRVAEQLKRTGGAKQYADSKAETAALFSDLSAGVLESVMGVHDGIGGAPIFRNGVTTVSNYGGTVKGLMEIFRPLSEMRSPEAFNLFQTWAAVKRGQRLDIEGREDLVEQSDVKAMQDLQRADPQMIKTFEAVQKDWLAYNNALVKYMKDTGVISPEMAKKWTEHGDYWPFYRLTAEEDIVGPKAFMSIGNVTPPKKLKKSENPLGDFFENVVRNSQSAIQAGMKNMAAQNATKQALMLGEVVRLKGREPGVNVYRVFENGKEVFYRASDPLFIEAIKALNMADIPFIGILAKPAAWLRNLVTKDPAFMLANMMRDSLSAWVTTGKNITPIYSTLRNFSQAIAGQSPYINELYAAGLLGGYDYATGTKDAARVFEKTLRHKAGNKTMLERSYSPVTSLWEALEKGTQASDAATRIEIYKKVLAETGNEAEALSQALEVMNFNRKGNSALIRVLTAAVPFLNARMQGLDVLYRSAIQPLVLGNASEEAKQRMKTFWMRGMLMVSTSMMYWLLTHDDDEYKKQEQETRDDNWLIPSLGIRIPIPFEVGVMFKVLPERIMELNFGGDTTKDFTLSMKRQFLNTFAFNPMPQTVKPLYEIATNHSFFTQRPIIGMGMERVEGKYQIGPSTSRIAQMIGEVSGFSPMKTDYLIKGYTGTIGTYVSDLIDMIWDMNSDAPKASKRFEQMPVIKRFILDPEARGTITAYYKFKEEVDTAVRTANYLERSNNFEELSKYTVENLTMLASRDYVNDIEKDMKDLREMRNQVVTGPYSADTKKELLRSISAMESALTSNIQRIKQFGQK